MNLAVSGSDKSIAFLAGPGEMAKRTRCFDWDVTSLGPPDGWRPTLKAMVRMMLTTQHPTFIFWGPEHICLYNDAYLASLGPEKHPAILGAPARSAWSEVWPVIGPQIKLVLRGEGATWHKNQLVPIVKNGKLEDGYWTYSFGPIDDEMAPNRVGGVLVLCTEATEQVLSGRRAEQEREHFKRLFDQAPTFTALLTGPTHVFELANPGYRRLVGNRRLIGETVAAAVPEALDQGHVALLDEAYRSGKAFTASGARFDVRTSSSGPYRERYIDFVYQPIKNLAGEVTGIFVEGVDVTDRRNAERSLQLSEDQFRMAVESSSLGTFEIDLKTHEVVLSSNAKSMFGLRGDRHTLAMVLAVIHPDDVDVVSSAVDHVEANDSDGMIRLRHRVTSDSDDLRTLSLSGRLVSDGASPRLMGVVWDVTEQQELLDTLQRADRRKDEFLATLAHELRNPLAVIRTSANLLLYPDLAPSKLAWCGELIQRHAVTMSALLDDLLEVSRISNGKLELRKSLISVDSVVRSAVEAASRDIDAKGHAFEVSMPEGEALFEADPIRMTQSLANLLTNAAKYTDPGGRIELKVLVDAQTVEFAVTDNGIGLSPEAIPSLFEMFRQVKGTLDRAQGGLGIGLAVTKGMVELHGGELRAVSGGLGKGSTFRVTLPRKLPLQIQLPVTQDGIQPPPETRARPRVLVVDDNVDAAAALAEILEMEGFEVCVANSGEQALAAVASYLPVAGVLDIGLGTGMDGHELARQLRKISGCEELFLIAVTGWGNRDDRERSAAAGFNSHLTKPVDPEAVLSLLSRCKR
jgi:PAS domain S-box-containing protein